MSNKNKVLIATNRECYRNEKELAGIANQKLRVKNAKLLGMKGEAKVKAIGARGSLQWLDDPVIASLGPRKSCFWGILL
jgi:hypothetical protein